MLKGYIFICRNAEGVHGKRKVGNPCSRKMEPQPTLSVFLSWKRIQTSTCVKCPQWKKTKNFTCNNQTNRLYSYTTYISGSITCTVLPQLCKRFDAERLIINQHDRNCNGKEHHTHTYSETKPPDQTRTFICCNKFLRPYHSNKETPYHSNQSNNKAYVSEKKIFLQHVIFVVFFCESYSSEIQQHGPA